MNVIAKLKLILILFLAMVPALPGIAIEWEIVATIEDPDHDVTDGIVVLSQTEVLILRDGYFLVGELNSSPKYSANDFKRVDLPNPILNQEELGNVASINRNFVIQPFFFKDSRELTYEHFLLENRSYEGLINFYNPPISEVPVYRLGFSDALYALVKSQMISIEEYRSIYYRKNKVFEGMDFQNVPQVDNINIGRSTTGNLPWDHFRWVFEVSLKQPGRREMASILDDFSYDQQYYYLPKTIENENKRYAFYDLSNSDYNLWINGFFFIDDLPLAQLQSRNQVGRISRVGEQRFKIEDSLSVLLRFPRQNFGLLTTFPYNSTSYPMNLVQVKLGDLAFYRQFINNMDRQSLESPDFYNRMRRGTSKLSFNVFRQFTFYPFDFSPRGNLFAFPEKDPATGLFKHWSVYRIILDGTLNNNSVRVRSAPNTTGSILTQLNRGARVKVLDRTDEEETIGGQTNYWYQIRLSDRREGWVFGAFLDVSRE